MNSAVSIPSLTDAESQRLAAQMATLAREMSAMQQVEDFAQSGWLPDRFFDLLGQIYAAYDAYIEHNIHGSALQIQCRAGCARCCMQAVHGVYSFEVIHLYRQLRALPEYGDIHNAFVIRADEFQRLLSEFMTARGVGDPNDPQVATYALARYAAQSKPCPLLRDNSCSVYAQRPVPCRMYHSLTHPIYCVTAQGRNFHIEPPQEANTILWELSSRLAFPFCEYLAQGLVSFAFHRQFRPWTAPQTA